MESIKGFIIHSIYEEERAQHVAELLKSMPSIERIEAIFPSNQKVPFLDKIIACSVERTGKALTPGEIGVLLTNRMIWRKIIKSPVNDNFPFLILESDSLINKPLLLQNEFYQLASKYDLFYFGGWLGNIQLLRSTKKKWTENSLIGTPLINTLCSGYGYSVNKKAARMLLKKTNKIAYAFDEVRRYLTQEELLLGAVLPEWISQKPGISSIGKRPTNWLGLKTWLAILYVRNYIICFFK